MGIELNTEGQLDPELARVAAQKLLAHGLRSAAIIHSGAAAAHLGVDGAFTCIGGHLLPAGQRVGSAGVDHAFAAGFLEGLYHNKPTERSLRQGLAVATVCKGDLTPSDGIKPLAECLDFYEKLGT
mgnify:CR=1 FL=1